MQSTVRSMLAGADLFLDMCTAQLEPGQRESINDRVEMAATTVESYRCLARNHPYFNELLALPAGFWCANAAFHTGSVHPALLLSHLDRLLHKLLSGSAPTVDAGANISHCAPSPVFH